MRLEGIAPVRRFVFRARNDNFVELPSEDGMEPTRQFDARLRFVKEVRPRKEKEMEPVK
jgi:hypothetical protein